MTEEQMRIVRQLRNEGYAVIIWAPEELSGVPLNHVEARSVELGWEIIKDLKRTNQEPEYF
ncbi:MAG: hypothetical protein DRR42_09880 [Gammaproteobacteria bacterium]|nr:MAG: hypothetical protein DRR42_09880 [Gammaproteobacteria bacterium]